jgi:5-methylcytosine-specific restriction endonuclease McrA
MPFLERVICKETRLLIAKGITMKACKSCKQDKPLTEYYSGKGYRGGKNPNCKECMKLNVNKENQNAAAKRYRDRYPERRLERDKKYRLENAQKVKAARNQYLEKKYSSDPTYRLQTILRQQIVDYIKHRKGERTAQLLGYTAQDFINHHGEGLANQHIDHKIPKSWFKDDAPVSVVWHIDNLQWLSQESNNSKYNKYADRVPESYLQIALPHILEFRLPYLNA